MSKIGESTCLAVKIEMRQPSTLSFFDKG